MGYSPQGRKESDMTEQLHFLTIWTFVSKMMSLLFKYTVKCVGNQILK